MRARRVLGYVAGGFVALGVLGAILGPGEEPGGSGGDRGVQVASTERAAAGATPEPAPQSQLVLEVPDDRDVFRDRVALSGKVSADPAGGSLAGVRVTVDGKTAPLSAGGRWSKTVSVERGGNDIDVEAEGSGFFRTSETVTLTRRQSQAERAAAAARRAAAAAARKQSYMAGAQLLPYNQLEKNPDRHAGERVKFTGQIFQIQEDLGSTVILLSVTDEGYGFWTDNICRG